MLYFGIGRGNTHVEESREHGCMLGVFPHALYSNEQLELRSGDCVLLYTDGVPETRNPGEEFLDTERVKTWLGSARGADAARFADAMLRQLREWRGRPVFDDDVTFVVARLALRRERDRSGPLILPVS